MGTLMQKKAAEITVETVRTANKKTKGEIIREAGYSEKVSLQPQKIFDAEGFKDELQNFGLTEDLIKTALVTDIKAKPGKRFLELSLGSEILGLKKQGNNGGNVNIQINVQNFGDKHTTPLPAKAVPTERT